MKELHFHWHKFDIILFYFDKLFEQAEGQDLAHDAIIWRQLKFNILFMIEQDIDDK